MSKGGQNDKEGMQGLDSNYGWGRSRRRKKKVPMVKEYLDAFPKELLGFPPDWEIEFIIDLIPNKETISIPHYRMVVVKLKELNEQVQELLDKEFI